MISIVTAYYNRKKLFERTLSSIAKQVVNYDLEVIAVDDGSDEEERIEDLSIEFPFLKVIRLEKINKWYNNSCVPFNIGFKHAKGDKIVIQNPECYHFNNVLETVNKELKDGVYLSFGCYSLDKYSTDNEELFYDKNYIKSLIEKNNTIITKDGGLGWYNHSLHRPEALHFCSAITAKDLEKIGFFDERFAIGIAYDDNELIDKVRRNLKISFIDNSIVLHQNHYSPRSTSYENHNEWEIKSNYNSRVLHNRFKFININSFVHFLPKSLKDIFIRCVNELEYSLREVYRRLIHTRK